MSDTLPGGWAKARIDEIAELNPRHPRDLDGELAVTFVPMPAVSESNPQLDTSQERMLETVLTGYTHFADGDVLFAKITPCMENGKGAVASGLRNGLGCGTTELHVIRPRCGIDPHYVYRFLAQRSVRREAKENFTGSAGQARVPASFMKELEIPLAPLGEQRRIVAKLEELQGKVDACQRRLAKIPRLLKRFRQSVLAAACSGRLTADWRKGKTTDAKDAVIQQKRCDAEDLPELPEEWQWVQFGSMIGELRNGVSLRPNMNPPGVPILRISSTRPGRVELTDVRYMPNGDEFVRLYRLRDGDLLFTRYNGSIELLGVCGMVRGLGDRTLLYPDKLMRVRFDHDWILPNYVEFFFSVPEVHARVVAKSKSSAGQNGVSGSDIKAQPFALPPLPEQREIVRRVEQLFTLADQLEARYAKAQAHVDKLTQSLLAKAFRGELVPQDRNDEPASALLARIRSESNDSAKPARRKARAVA